MTVRITASADTKADERALVSRAIERDETAIRAIVTANNRRLYRIARSIIPDDGEAEDVLQEAYLHAFAALRNFRGDASLSTWLTRIVFNEALQRKRRRVDIAAGDTAERREAMAEIIFFPLTASPPVDPEKSMAQREINQLLQRAIDDLPEEFRTVLVARLIEEMSTEETAELLDIRPETVKTRLHRARQLIKTALAEHIGPMFSDVFPFDGKRCERMTNAVVQHLNLKL